jgi:hypothetical protein
VAGRVFEDLLSTLRVLDEMYERGGGGVVVAGPSECVMMLLDNAVVPYSEVKAVAPAHHAVVAEGWRAERLLEAVGWTEGAKDMYFLVVCPIGDSCVFHLYGFDGEEDFATTAAYLVMLAMLDGLAGEALARGLCVERDDCLGYVVSRVKALAPVYRPALLGHLSRVTEPHEIYCTRDMLLEHKRGGRGMVGGEGEVPAGGH